MFNIINTAKAKVESPVGLLTVTVLEMIIIIVNKEQNGKTVINK